MASDLKTCQYCKKDVSIEAIKCPYCQEWLNKRDFSFQNPVIRTLLFILLILTVFYIGPKLYFAKKIQKLTQPPATYRTDSKLTILNHRISKSIKGFSILGEIENKEKFKWATVTVMVTFKDEKNVVSTLGTGYVNNLNPGSKKPFEVNFACGEELFDPKKHASYTIEIEDARGEFNTQNIFD